MNQKKIHLSIVVILFSLLAASILSVKAGLFAWSHLGRLTALPGFEPSVSAIATDPDDSAVIYAGTLHSTDDSNLVFKSVDGGFSWQPASGGLPDDHPQNTGVNDLVIRPDAPAIIFAGLYKAGVWQSLNGGKNWSNVTNGSIAANDTVRALALDPTLPGTVYALTGSGVHVSIDGDPWESRSSGLPSANEAIFNDLAADAARPGTLYAATNPLGLFRSINGGQSWQPVNDDLPDGVLDVRGIAASAVNGRLLISITGLGLWRSDDQGDTWTRSDAGITYNTTLQGNVGIPILSSHIASAAYVYNNDGVFSSANGGEDWTPFNDGFSGAETISTMAFHPAAPDTVYAGTSVSGVWSLTVVPGGRYYFPFIKR